MLLVLPPLGTKSVDYRSRGCGATQMLAEFGTSCLMIRGGYPTVRRLCGFWCCLSGPRTETQSEEALAELRDLDSMIGTALPYKRLNQLATAYRPNLQG